MTLPSQTLWDITFANGSQGFTARLQTLIILNTTLRDPLTSVQYDTLHSGKSIIIVPQASQLLIPQQFSPSVHRR